MSADVLRLGRRVSAAAAALLLGAAGLAAAADRPPAPVVADNPLGGAAPPLAETALSTLRGGYTLPGGLVLAFGITQRVYVDGALVSSVTRFGADAALPTTVPSSTAAVVQNAVDGRHLQATTLIDASANSLGLVRQWNLQSSLRGAVIDSLRR